MTILGLTIAEWFSLAALLGTAFSFWSMRRYRAAQTAVTFTQADSTNVADALKLKAEYKADLKDLRAELEEEHTARKAVEDQLEAANKIIAELQDRDVKREAAMTELQNKFDRDALLRANIEEALQIATDRIKQLERDNLDLAMRLTAVEQERAKEQSVWSTERRIWRNGIWKVIKQITDLNPGVVPAWRPPDTQPLGKLNTDASDH